MSAIVWSGLYLSASDAESGRPEGHQSVFGLKPWLERQGLLAKITAETVELTGRCQGARPSILPAVLAGRHCDVVFDLGGGSGWVHSLVSGLGIEPMRYIVLELPAVEQYFKTHPVPGVEFASLSELSFTPNLEIVLYANSSLQYMPDNELLLEHTRKLQPRTLVLDELLWTNEESDWFAIQVNSEVTAVARFASLGRLIAQLARLGMRLVWEGSFGAGHRAYTFPDMSNYPSHLAIDHAKSLIFVRDTNLRTPTQ